MSENEQFKIEITPEMIEAGRLLLFEYTPDFDNEDEVVSAIFREMFRLHREGAGRHASRAQHPT